MTDLSEIQAAIRRGLKALEAPPPKRLSEWAEDHFYLSAESSYVEQKWQAFPYQPAIMDCISNDDIQEVDWQKSARVGYTKILLAAMAYFAEHKRRNQCIWQPTDEDADEFVKTELEPALRDIDVMRNVFPDFIAKNKKNTLRQKMFLGSTTYVRGGKAAKNYRRISVDISFLDELDGFDQDIEKEGSPITLARKRTEGATFPKLIAGSTPKLKGLSMIESREQQAEKRFRYKIPCPHCSAEHELTWGGKDKSYGMKWIDNDPETAAQLCASCATLYTQADYLKVWGLGRWVDKDGIWIDPKGRFVSADGHVMKTPLSVGFHIWTAYSPMTSWEQIVREFLQAKTKARAGDKSELKSFVNTTLGETWEDDVEQSDQVALMARAEPYAMRTCPQGVLILTAAVDVQSNRFEIVVWGWGRGEEMWAIDYTVLEANPADERDWDKLDVYLQSRFPHIGGQTLALEAVAIDTGGHFTHQAYNFCRTRTHRKVFAVKGDSKHGMPVKGRASMQDVNHRGKVIKRGVKLWFVGTDTAKDLLHGRLSVGEPGPGYVHFSKDLPQAFYEQLTAEVRVIQKTAQGEQHRWVKKGPRNEALDCTVYATFAAHTLDLPRYTDKMWERLESIVNPAQGDIFNNPVTQTHAQPISTEHTEATTPQAASSGLSISKPPEPENGFGSADWSSRW